MAVCRARAVSSHVARARTLLPLRLHARPVKHKRGPSTPLLREPRIPAGVPAFIRGLAAFVVDRPAWATQAVPGGAAADGCRRSAGSRQRRANGSGGPQGGHSACSAGGRPPTAHKGLAHSCSRAPHSAQPAPQPHPSGPRRSLAPPAPPRRQRLRAPSAWAPPRAPLMVSAMAAKARPSCLDRRCAYTALAPCCSSLS